MHGIRLIAGSGRSGTTWVLDALAEANGLRPVFEPLNPSISDIGARYAYRALAADDEHPDLERFLTDVCEGRRHKWWTQYRRPNDRLIPPLSKLTSMKGLKLEYHRWKKFLEDQPTLSMGARRSSPLVKCIRANLMLNWLSRRHACKIVLLVRHPGAVVESQLRLRRGGVWDPEPVLTRYQNDSCLHELTGNRYRKLLSRQLSPIEALAVNWVIENQWAIERAAINHVTVVFYEQLKASPACEWQRICRALDLPHVPQASVIARPSQQSSSRHIVAAAPMTEEPSWRRGLTVENVALIQRVLDEAGFDSYSMSTRGPLHVADKPIPCHQARDLV